MRAPVEFLKGAIPRASNHPLLNDDERERVGRCYKQEGQDAALRLGHRLVSGDAREARIQAWSAWARPIPRARFTASAEASAPKSPKAGSPKRGSSYPASPAATKPCANTFSTSLTGKAPAFPGA